MPPPPTCPATTGNLANSDTRRMAGEDRQRHVLEPPPLVETKLLPPRPRRDALRRARLLEQLDNFAPAALTLVDAPVGFGKTMLVQSWCAAQTEVDIAWVSI